MHALQCQCGQVRAQVEVKGTSNHVICYCSDCRAFAHFLEKGADILDTQGGTEIVQINQANLHLLQGKEQLGAVRLSENGMLRWYTTCCKTPIGNTMTNPKMGFVGLISTAMDKAKIEKDFGPVNAWVETESALGTPKPTQRGLFVSIVRFLKIVVATRMSGSYKRSALFTSTGEPIVKPVILTSEQLSELKKP